MSIPETAPVRRRRGRHPRALHGLPPREGATRSRCRLGRRHRRPRQVEAGRRGIRHRLRRRPQQLLPAGDERAHAGLRRGLGVGSRGVPLQLGRLHRTGRAGPGVGSHRDVRAPGAHRLPLRAHHRRGRGRRAYEGALPGLARARGDDLPSRASGRVRVQRRVRARATGQVPRRGRLGARGSRGHRVRLARRRLGLRGRDTRGRHRGRRAGRDRAGTVGRPLLGRCSACRTRSTSRLRRATSFATVRCGPTGIFRKARSRSIR